MTWKRLRGSPQSREGEAADARNVPAARPDCGPQLQPLEFEQLRGWFGEDPVAGCLRQSGVGLDDARRVSREAEKSGNAASANSERC